MSTFALCVGCASVNLEADYASAGALIKARTESSDVYDPATEAGIKDRVATLLQGDLTVDEAQAVALLNNPAFQSKFLEIGASRADVVQSGLLQNPVMAVSGRLPQGGGRVNLSFSFAQELLDLWRIPVRKKIAREALEKTVTDVVREALTLQGEVRQAAYTYLAARDALAVTEENRTLLHNIQELTQHRFEAGEATALDVRLIQAEVMDLDVGQLAQQQELDTARLELGRVLGLSRWEQPWDLSDTLPTPSEPLPDDAALLALAADERLDLQMASQDIQAEEDKLLEQYRSVFPNLTLGIDGERPELRAPRSRNFAPLENTEIIKGPGYTPQAARLDAAHLAGDFLRNQLAAKRERDFEKQQAIDLLLGPSAEITLPLWDQNKAQIAKARIRVVQKRKDYDDSLDRATTEVLQAAAVARNAGEAVRIAEEKSLPQAQATLETAQRVYQAGEESILVLMAAQQSLLRQRQAHAAAQSNYALALAALENAVGGKLPAKDPAPHE